MKSILTLVFAIGVITAALAQQQSASVEERLAAQEREIAQLRTRVANLERQLNLLRDTPGIKIPAQVRNNLQIMDAALQQYCLEHKVAECKYSDLVGEGKYIDAAGQKIADGERYDGLRLALDEAEWRIVTKSGFIVIFTRHPTTRARLEELFGK